jgi:hypothetical protein
MAGFNDDVVFAQEGMRIGDETISTSEQASIQFDEPSEDVALLIANTSDDAASSAYEEIKLNSVNSGESFTRYRAGDTASFAFGMLANSSIPRFSLTFKNDGECTPNSWTNIPIRCEEMDPGTGTAVTIIRSRMAVASEGTGESYFVVNSNNDAGVVPLIQLIQTNGSDNTHIHWAGGNGSNWHLGTDASDNSNFYITTASVSSWPPTAGNTKGRITQEGEVTWPQTPAFLATQTVAQTNITGSGAGATISFTTEVFDQNSDYDGTNTFTAPVTGRYLFSYIVQCGSVSNTTTFKWILVTLNRNYVMRHSNGRNEFSLAGGEFLSSGGSIIADMDAGDTASVVIVAAGLGGNTIDTTGNPEECFFAGSLIC